MSQITLKPLDDGQKAVVIPLGKTTIGRGPFLGCSDKKVSRNHAVLEVTSKGEVYLTPTHVNPCFYRPTADNPGQILKKDVPHKLENGDSFSLLPRAYRYQLNVIGDEKKADQNDLNKGKTNGSTGDVPEDVHKDPAKGVCNVEPSDTVAVEKSHSKSEVPKEENSLPPKRSSPEAANEGDKAKEPSPPKENNVLHKDNPPEEDKDRPKEDTGDEANHVGGNSAEVAPASDDKTGEVGKEVKKAAAEDKKTSEDSTEEKRTESCEESRDEGTLDTLPSKVSEGEEEGSKPAKRGGRKKAVAAKPPPAEKPTKRKAASATRGRKKAVAAKFDFGPGEEGNSSQRVAGRTSSRTNRQTRQGLSLEDFIVSDDDEWQSDPSSPKQKRRKKRGSRRKDDSGSDWEIEHKKPKRPLGAKAGSGSESGSDWGTTPKKKGGPKGKRRKGKTNESEEAGSDGDQPTSSTSVAKQRIPCTYGKKCYRRNQNHVEQFSHPGDSDYTSDTEPSQKEEPVEETESVKKECPYGANCFRKNAQHKKDFKHTKKVRPQREAAKLADKKAKGSKNSEEVDSYDLNESFLNDESADEYKQADSGSDYESGERSKKLAKAKVAVKGGKRGRKA